MARAPITRKIRSPRVARWLLLAWLLALANACGESEPALDPARTGAQTLGSADLPEIRTRGVLRVLTLRNELTQLPRTTPPHAVERRLLENLGRDLGLRVEYVYVDQRGELLPALNEGRGDIAANNLTRTAERAQSFAFSAPIAFVNEVVVVAAGESPPRKAEDLAGMKLGVQRASSYWLPAERLAQQVPGLLLESLPNELTKEQIFDAVKSGKIDATLSDSNYTDAILTWREDIQVAFALPESRIVAWAMRPEDRELHRAVDRFLARAHHADETAGGGKPDLAGIVERGVLRILTRNSDTTYFIWRGQILGFEFELAERFAQSLGVRLEVVVPPSRNDLFPWLLEGKGDLVAAGLTASKERAEQRGIAFSRHYQTAVETLATRADDDSVSELADLTGRFIHVRKSSSYWHTLGRMQQQGLAFTRVAVPEELETEEILSRVASGDYDLTVADSPILDVALAWSHNLRAAFPIGEKVEYGWAVRPRDTELLAVIDAYFDREYRGLFYNVTHRKYFEDPRKVVDHVTFRASRAGQISPWDDLVRQAAVRHGFDWRLLVAQMYKESGFDPDARSFAGATGLFQVMPRTAKELGVNDLVDPASGIAAGVRYLEWTRNRFEATLSPQDRIWFSLAAYNVGPGHVRDARRIASEQGWDPDVWFNNVERAMLLKERPEIHKHTRFGYARGSEPVAYVRAIRDRYTAYLDAETTATQSDPPQAPAKVVQ